jgi:hypothetical protein
MVVVFPVLLGLTIAMVEPALTRTLASESSCRPSGS